MAKKKEINLAIENRKAKYNFLIEDSIEAGIVLTGDEIKSIRNGKISIDNSYATEKDNAIWLLNSNIQVPKGSIGAIDSNPTRPRKLLLKKKEINKIRTKLLSSGFTLIPLNIHYNSKGLAKVQIGISKGRKKEDKREYKKEQDWKREKGRLIAKQFK